MHNKKLKIKRVRRTNLDKPHTKIKLMYGHIIFITLQAWARVRKRFVHRMMMQKRKWDAIFIQNAKEKPRNKDEKWGKDTQWRLREKNPSQFQSIRHTIKCQLRTQCGCISLSFFYLVLFICGNFKHLQT